MQGWIKLHRKIMLHEFYNEKPFTRLSAWIDLLLLANHENRKVLFDGNLIDIERGQHITSIRKLCDRWGWSNSKVARFLDVLKNEGMIVYFSDKKKTLVTIDNYDLYQDSNDEEAPLKRQRNDTETSLKHTNKNDKNVKNEKKNNKVDFDSKIEIYTNDLNLRETLSEFINHRNSGKHPLTELAFTKLLKKLDTFPNKIDVLNQSIINGWTGIFECKTSTTELQNEVTPNAEYLRLKQQVDGGENARG